MSGSEFDRWLTRVRRLETEQVRPSDVDVRSLAERLIALDRLMRSSPIMNAYARFKEAELIESAEARIGEIEADRWGWSLVAQTDPRETLRPLAVEIRAIDALLRRVRPKEAPADANRDWRYDRLNAFVIPCRERRVGAGGGRARQPYERRGILQHRILPTRLGKFRVRLWGGGSVTPRALVGPPEFRGGAALFSGLAIQLHRRHAGLFTVATCRAPDHSSQIDAALAEAHVTACTALVWPEVTISPADRRNIRSWLARRLLGPYFDAPMLSVVVAGSWHEHLRGRPVNRSVVYDGAGRKLLEFEKSEAVHFDVGTEDIHESRRLEVLCLDGLLIGFGICRDFAESQAANPFPGLDVDLFLVPSMGNARTAEGHRETAGLTRSRFSAESFVVQQTTPGTAGPLGVVIHDCRENPQDERFRAYPPSITSDTSPKS